MNNIYENICKVISAAMFGIEAQFDEGTDWNNVFKEMKEHGIASLASDILPQLPIDDELKRKWKDYCFQQQVYWEKVITVQDDLCASLGDTPYVIVKGMSASLYYPNPRTRSLGDIDVLVRVEDFNNAASRLEENEYSVVETSFYKHNNYKKSGVDVELHDRYATKLTITGKHLIEDGIFDEVLTSRMVNIGQHYFKALSDTWNGIAILYHIYGHFNEGIGLRQIIDWMMFVGNAPDVDWNAFNDITKTDGIYGLQCALTKMCRMHFGLSQTEEISWSDEVNDATCEVLFDYISSGGNFGSKRSEENMLYKASIYSNAKLAFSRLQKGGMCRWKAAQKYRVLRPFAWMYQGIRIVVNTITRQDSAQMLKKDIEQTSRIYQMFDNLNIPRTDPRGKVSKSELEKLTARG